MIVKLIRDRRSLFFAAPRATAVAIFEAVPTGPQSSKMSQARWGRRVQATNKSAILRATWAMCHWNLSVPTLAVRYSILGTTAHAVE